jgi:hypothetical protein
MTIVASQFRTDYPEFGDLTVYPDSQLTYWLNLAYLLLNAARWGTTLDVGAELFVAHNVSIEARAQQEASNGAIPGAQTGPVSSKSVDKVSVSYDAGAGIEEKAGHWNLTVYGTRFIKLARMMGAGPIYVGVGSVPSGSGQGWYGPNTTPGFSNFG